MDKKGITLIEIVISLAIFGIMLASIFTILDTGMFNIKKSGDLTNSVYNTKVLLDTDISMLENTASNELDFTVSVTIPGVINERNVLGKYIQKTIVSDHTLSTFVP